MAEPASATTSALPPPSDSLPARPTTDEAPKAPEVAPTAATTAPATEVAGDSDKVAAPHEAQAPKFRGDSVVTDAEAKDHSMVDAEKPSTEAAVEKAPDATDEAPVASSNNTPASKKGKRKSSNSVPEHRAKKLNRKKSQALTHLDAQPGEYYFARLKGHPPWPAMICDEEMLPHVLLVSRPVTAKRLDGTYREDVADGGKRVNERTFPVMFMDTYEFAWIPNTDLTPLNLDTIGDEPEKGKSKGLLKAYKMAAEKHDIEYFKNLLKEHQAAIQADAEAKAAAKAKKAKGKGKNKASADDEDVEMEDAGDDEDEESKTKTKKRKKDADSDGEDAKPAKTPKRSDSSKKSTSTPKLKLSNPKTPNGTSASKSAAKGSSAKAKAKTSTNKKTTKKAKDESEEEVAVETPVVEEKPLTVAEMQEKKQKEILFLRHKLQKGFLTRDQPPKEEEMKAMSDYISKLETYADLEASIMRATKINKVLKGIGKLNSIPKDAEYKFKERSYELLKAWNRVLAADGGDAGDAGDAGDKEGAVTNGVSKEDKSDEDKPEREAPASEEPKKTEPTPAEDDASKAEKVAAAAEEGAKVDEKTTETEKVDAPIQETRKEPEAVEAS